ncbi:hypothetical protein [Kangiella sp. M94]
MDKQELIKTIVNYLIYIALGAIIFYLVAPGERDWGGYGTEPVAICLTVIISAFLTFHYSKKVNKIMVSMVLFVLGSLIVVIAYPFDERYINKPDDFDVVLSEYINNNKVNHIIKVYKPKQLKPWFSSFIPHKHKVIIFREPGYSKLYIYIAEGTFISTEIIEVVEVQ